MRKRQMALLFDEQRTEAEARAVWRALPPGSQQAVTNH
jgi:hypothetical protein